MVPNTFLPSLSITKVCCANFEIAVDSVVISSNSNKKEFNECLKYVWLCYLKIIHFPR